MEEFTIILKLLNLDYNNDKTISTLALSIRGARELTERNIKTGKISTVLKFEKFEKQCENLTFESNKFIGLATYLITIDLIGNLFSIKGKPQCADKFKQTLNQFSTLNIKQIDSLKNLRNSLAHKFSLGNESEIFEIDYSTGKTEIIECAKEIYPSIKRTKPKEDKNFTTAYFHNICNLVESIYNQLVLLNSKNEIELLKKYRNGNSIKIYDLMSMYFVK